MPKNASGKSISPLPAGLSQAEMRERLVHERRVEFYQEEHRYFDLNRWKRRSAVTVYGHTLTRDASFPTGINFTVKEWLTKTWDEKYYLLPLQEDELNRNTNLKQNPGWNALETVE